MGESDLLEFVLRSTEERVVVYDRSLKVVFRNERAARFLASHDLPPEVPSLAARIVDAIDRGCVARDYPGSIRFSREVAGRPWVFRMSFREAPSPLVCVFFFHETVSGRFDLNAIRGQYRLTRRETDLTRHLLDGMSNREIAEDLSITEQTVKDHLSSVYRKVGVQDRYGLLRHLVAAARP